MKREKQKKKKKNGLLKRLSEWIQMAWHDIVCVEETDTQAEATPVRQTHTYRPKKLLDYRLILPKAMLYILYPFRKAHIVELLREELLLYYFPSPTPPDRSYRESIKHSVKGLEE